MYDDYMNTKETATFLKVSKSLVEKWRKKGWLMPDVIGHGKNGHHDVFYYSKERILQLASVYLNNDAHSTHTQTEYEDNLTHTVRVLAVDNQKKNCDQTATTSATDKRKRRLLCSSLPCIISLTTVH